MELVDGASLQAQLARSGALPAREAVTVCRDVAHALQHAHERGVIHRDVKPANVFMDRAGRGRQAAGWAQVGLSRVRGGGRG
ncbi:MAG TPA: protein kinase [Anaerolineae bacterium]|nr:protein kinase [Anaerolineae bacterium]